MEASRRAFDEISDAEGQHFGAAPTVKLETYTLPEGLKDASEDNVTLPMSAKKLAGLRVELFSKVKALRCTQVVARIEHDRATGLPNGGSEHVRKSRSQSSPGMDQHDRDLKRWERNYERGMRDALRALEVCRGIEEKVLVKVREPSAVERLAAIGDISPTALECQTCHEPVEPENVRGKDDGLTECYTCYRYRARHGGEPRPRDLWGAA